MSDPQDLPLAARLAMEDEISSQARAAQWRRISRLLPASKSPAKQTPMVSKQRIEIQREVRERIEIAETPSELLAERKSAGSVRKPVATTVRINILGHDWWCRYCMNKRATTLDHVVPVSRGGSNSPENLVGCCSTCNTRKANFLPKEAGMLLHLPVRFFDYV